MTMTISTVICAKMIRNWYMASVFILSAHWMAAAAAAAASSSSAAAENLSQNNWWPAASSSSSAAAAAGNSSQNWWPSNKQLQPLQSANLCKECSKCTEKQCPISDKYPHLKAWDGSLIAGPLQSDLVSQNDRGVYAVPDVKGGQGKSNSYYGWKWITGSSSGYHRFENYMDKCSKNSFLIPSADGKVGVNGLTGGNLESADWKLLNPPLKENHKGFRYFVSRTTRECLTVSEVEGSKRAMVLTPCKFDGSVTCQLFAFRFHYHKAFCCCNVHNS